MGVSKRLTFIGDLRRYQRGDKTRVLRDFVVSKSSPEVIEGISVLVPSSSSGFRIPLGGIGSEDGQLLEGQLLILQSDRAVDVKINEATEGVRFKELFVIGGGNVGKVEIVNTSGSEAHVELWAVGSSTSE